MLLDEALADMGIAAIGLICARAAPQKTGTARGEVQQA